MRSPRILFLFFVFITVTSTNLWLPLADGGIIQKINHFFAFVVQKLFYAPPPPQATMTTPQMIQFNGFPVEEHKVVSTDGFILTLFRIPPLSKTTNNYNGWSDGSQRRPPVLIQHGILASSDDWLLVPGALPYVLASRGHDVWLGNGRGNRYSMEHTRLSKMDPKFWDFSFDEYVHYDLPTCINYILHVTGASQLSYVGHSVGTLLFFLVMTEHPEFNDKVNRMVALAPVYHVGNTVGLVTRLPTLIPNPILQVYFKHVTGGHVFPGDTNRFVRRYAPLICSTTVPREVCNNIVYVVGGYNPQQITKETAALIAGHSPSDTSGRGVMHLAQTVNRGKPAHFDFGPHRNLQIYGTPTPRPYNISGVRVPVQAWYTLNDILVVPQDAKRTISELSNVVETIQVDSPMWTHADFTYGKDARFYVYERVAQFLEAM